MKPVCSGSNTDPSNTSSRSRCRCSAHPFRLCMSVCDMRDLIALLSTQIACTISVACLCLHAAVVNGFEQIKSDLHLPILNTSIHPSSHPSIHLPVYRELDKTVLSLSQAVLRVPTINSRGGLVGQCRHCYAGDRLPDVPSEALTNAEKSLHP